MNSVHFAHAPAANCRTAAPFRLSRIVFSALLSLALASAQPASITTIPQAIPGQATFDAAGNLYHVGSFANAKQFVTPGAAQTQGGGGTCPLETGLIGTIDEPCVDAYVGKTDTGGGLVWGTLLGGPTNDQSNAIAVDSAGNVYVAGSTGGSFPTTKNAANAASSSAKAFAAKISADGTRILYSTYLPDTAGSPNGIAVDAQGNAYVSGVTGSKHAYILKLSADGSAFSYYKVLSGSGQDSAGPIGVDAAGNATVAGTTTSSDFPVTAGALQTAPGGAFVTRLNATGDVVFSTYLGGTGTDRPQALRIGPDGSISISGSTSSLDFPTTAGSFHPTPLVPSWNTDSVGGFVSRISTDGSALIYSTYVPSTSGVSAMAISASGEVYIAGLTGPMFPVTHSAPQFCFSRVEEDGETEAVFVARLDPQGALLDATYVPHTLVAVPGDLLPSAGGWAWVALSTDVARVVFGGADWSPASCLSSSVLNGATLTQGLEVSVHLPDVVPGEVITLTGFGIGPDAGVAFSPGPQGQVPTQVAGVQVLFDGKPAPVLYAQSQQVNAIAPVGIKTQTATTISVLYNNQAIGSTTATVAYGDPGFFRLQPNVSSQAIALNQDLTINSAENPAPRGSTVALFGTGFGVPDSCTDGTLNFYGPSDLPSTETVWVFQSNPLNLIPASYAGGAPTLACGVVQINVPIPTSIPPGKFTPSAQLLFVFPNGREGIHSAGAVDIAVK